MPQRDHFTFGFGQKPAFAQVARGFQQGIR
jgi:hypothetical protein